MRKHGSPEKQEKPERPEITQTHKDFYKRVVAISTRMTELACDKVKDRVGDFPSEESRSRFQEFSTLSVSFRSEAHRYRSRLIKGDIAGSDAFAFTKLELPEEAWVNRDLDPLFPGRIIDMTLFYGEDEKQGWGGVLYAGKDTPPIIADKETIVRLGPDRPSEGSISSLGVFMERFPESNFIFPTEQELQTVLGGLAIAQEDIDLHGALQAVHYDYTENMLEVEDPNREAHMQWFKQSAARFQSN